MEIVLGILSLLLPERPKKRGWGYMNFGRLGSVDIEAMHAKPVAGRRVRFRGAERRIEQWNREHRTDVL